MKNTLLKVGKAVHDVSPLLYGLFLEDINYACDGGLNMNMVRNHSFNGVHMDKTVMQMDLVTKKIPPVMTPDRLRHWECTGGEMTSCEEKPASEKNPWYARIQASDNCMVINRGYDGSQKQKGKCTISVKSGHTYEVSCYLRNVDFDGRVFASVISEDGQVLLDKTKLSFGSQWAKSTVHVIGKNSGYGMLRLEFAGKGTIDVDCVNLSDTDFWGKDDPKWTGGHFRKDMVEALAELHPSFLRFPGGCIVEGACPGNEYHWKDTVGPLIDRKEAANLWAAAEDEKDYCQSCQIGFYEYFLLCEDLKMEPLPIVWAGLNCQFRSIEKLDTESEAFDQEVVKNALDLIEYANGDPETSEWAKVRALAGHPRPFNMKMIGIGNENYGKDYHAKFEKVKKAVHEKYPEMICIMSSGAFPEGEDFEETWRVAKEKHPDVRIDEHFYKANEWLYDQVTRYDSYPRDTAKVFLGEYAANDVMTPHMANTFGSALAEAAFLTGVERNSDVVVMTSYAPLFSMVDGMQWNHNMIWFNPNEVLKTPNYFVQKMFGQYTGKKVLSFEGILPEGVYVSIMESEDAYIVKAVNATEETQELVITLPEICSGTTTHIKMQSDDLEACNEMEFYGKAIYHVVPVESEWTSESDDIMCNVEKYSVNVYKVRKQDIR